MMNKSAHAVCSPDVDEMRQKDHHSRLVRLVGSLARQQDDHIFQQHLADWNAHTIELRTPCLYYATDWIPVGGPWFKN